MTNNSKCTSLFYYGINDKKPSKAKAQLPEEWSLDYRDIINKASGACIIQLFTAAINSVTLNASVFVLKVIECDWQ